MAPSTHTAAVLNDAGTLELKTIPVPKAGENEVLIKVVAAGLNPTDWKTIKWRGTPGAVSGCDLAGVVEELGKGTETAGLKVGDRVTTFVAGGGRAGNSANGAFAEYAVAPANLCTTLPDSWTFEQGAQIAVAAYTAFQTLYQSLGLPIPPSGGSNGRPLLVYGASSVVGLYVTQVAKVTGFQVFAVCSPKNYDLVKSFGADATFDYRDPEVSRKIKDASNGKIQLAVDAISEGDSAKIIAGALSSEGGKIATVFFYSDDAKAALGSNITHEISVLFDLLVDRPDAPSRLSDAPKYRKLATSLLADGKIKPAPTRVWGEKGLEGINDALQYMMGGKVSGEKVVFRIADTPSIA